MKHIDRQRLSRLLGLLLLVAVVCVCADAGADVGYQNRYSDAGSSSSDGDDGLAGFLAGLLVSFIFDHPMAGLGLAVVIFVWWLIARRKKKKDGDTQRSGLMDDADAAPAYAAGAAGSAIAERIRAIDPMFSSAKFTAWVREVFLKLQQAWTARDWKGIRPFESEELFAAHNAQLNELIQSGKINVVEKIGIKSCELVSFDEDGDKETLTVRLGAVMRDYVVDAATRKVLESDPDKDWHMTYLMTFARKRGVKTQVGLSNKSTTNCPNCGAPTEITSAGQCEYCGSVITTGEHDWVLTDIHSID